VSVNGAVVRELGQKADPARDHITVDGEAVHLGARRTVVLHKPRGVVSTLADLAGRPTVVGLLGGIAERLYPVGRLDVNTTGLLLVTNDGALAAGLLHPRRGVPRTYHAKVRGAPDATAIARLRRGVRLEDGKTAPARVRVLQTLPTKTWLEVTVREGRQHLVRRMCAAVGHPVEKLARVRLGPLFLGDLPLGAWRDLGPRELAALRYAAGLSPRPGGEGGAAPERRRRGRLPRKPRPRPASPRAAGARDGASGPPEGRPRPPGRRPRSPRP
jgi:23S rRNA pseudouridine2605 synthase